MGMTTGPEPDESTAVPPVRLLRVLGLGFGVAVGIGSIIGAGILRSPGDVAAQLPVPWLFFSVWLIAGLYALLGANSLSEIGTMLPRSGGQYVYAQYSLGPYAGFLVGWTDWIATCGSVAAVAIVIAESLGALFPLIASYLAITGAAIVLLFSALLWRGAHTSDRAQRITSSIKALGFLILIGACFALGGDRGVAHATVLHAPTGLPLVAAFVIALQGAIFAYDGWTGVIYFSEEMRDPGRQIPRAMFGGLLSVMAIYLLLNAAFLYVLPMSAMASSKLVAATAARQLFGAQGDLVVRALIIVALPSAVTANLLMASRVAFSLGRDRLATRAAARVNERGTPTVALLLTTVGAVLFVLTGTYETVIALLAFFFVATYGISFASVFILRHREPDAPRPYRAWGHPWTTGLVLAGSIAFLVAAIASDTRNSLYALILLVTSYPVFLVMRRAV